MAIEREVIEQVKRIDLVALLQAKGIELKKNGKGSSGTPFIYLHLRELFADGGLELRFRSLKMCIFLFSTFIYRCLLYWSNSISA